MLTHRADSAIALVVATSILVGCSQRVDDAKSLQVVRVSGRLAIANAPLLIADEEGFFAREGIKLEYVTLPTTMTQSIPALEMQQVDVLGAQLNIGFFNAIAKGARARLVADRGHVESRPCEFTGIVGRKSLFGAREPRAEDVRGRRFSVNAAGASGYLAARYLSSIGLTLSDIEVVSLPDNVTVQALGDGSVDAMFASEPRLTPSIRDGHPLIAPASKYTPGFQYGVVVFGPSLLVTNRDLGQRFINAYLRGVRQHNQGMTKRNVEIIARRAGVGADTLRSLCVPPIRNDGGLDFESIMQFQKWGVERGHQIRTLSPAEFADAEFVRKAAAAVDSEAVAR